MPVPLLPSPTHLTPAQRALEITRILAGAVRRLEGSARPPKEPVGLGFSGHQRLNDTPLSTKRVS